MDVMINYIKHLPLVKKAATPAASTAAAKPPKQKTQKKKSQSKGKKEKPTGFRIGIGAASIAIGGTAFSVILALWGVWVIFILNLSGVINFPR
jgi:hypothetical protein